MAERKGSISGLSDDEAQELLERIFSKDNFQDSHVSLSTQAFTMQQTNIELVTTNKDGLEHEISITGAGPISGVGI